MAVGAYPKNVNETFNILWNYADETWFLAGDRYICLYNYIYIIFNNFFYIIMFIL